MEKKKFQIIEKSIASGATVNIDEYTKADHNEIKAIFITSSDVSGTSQSTLELSLDKEEILPTGFAADLIEADAYNVRNEVKYEVNEKAGGSKIEGSYTDGAQATAYPYTLKIYLETTQI